MKSPISKSNIRRPLKSILLLTILLVSSNLFISSISQFYIVNREVDNIGRYYRSVGYLVPIDYNYYDAKDVQRLITDDPMMAYENGIRQTTGLIDGLYTHNKSSRTRSQIIGEYSFDLVFIGEIKEAYKSRSAENIYEGSLLNTKVIDILGGVPDYIESDLFYKDFQEHHIAFLSHSIETGEKNDYINDDIIDELYELNPGKKYIFRSELANKFGSGTFAKPLYEGGPLYIELDDSGEIDWDNPEFKIIKDEIDFINQNIISYSTIGTEDMTGMPEVQDGSKDYYLIDGRWIDNRDNENKNRVVVINQLLAEMYELKIGDKLQIKMRDSEYGSVLRSEKDKKEWRTYNTNDTMSFEIVGLYESNVFKGYHKNIYIPESTIPKELGRYNKGIDEPIPVYPYLYNFVLRNSEDESAFIEKYREPIEELGFELKFVVNNIDTFLNSSASIKRSSMISFSLFSILLIIVQGFVVHIYIEGHKLNYAIERSLGIPSKITGKHLIQPLILLGALASTIGGYIGYNTALEKSNELLASIPSSMERIVSSDFGIQYFILFITLSLIPLVAILYLRSRQLKNQSVIDLINNNKRKKDKVEDLEMVKATTISTVEYYEEKESTETVKSIDKEVKKEEKEIRRNKEEHILIKDGKKALNNYFLNHALRSKVSSILLIVLAGVFAFSLLWMNYLTIKNNDMMGKAYKEYTITADIVPKDSSITNEGTGPISKSHVDNLSETGLVKDYNAIALMIYDELYIKRDDVIKKYEVGEKDKVHFYTYEPSFRVEASNKPYNSDEGTMRFSNLNFMEGYSLEDFEREYTVDYTDPRNLKVLDEKGEVFFPVLVSSKAMEHFDLELGDKILLKPDSNYLRLVVEAYGTVVGSFEGVNRISTANRYTMVDEKELFIYPISALESLEHTTYYSKVELIFNPEKNKELMGRKEELKNILSSNHANLGGMNLNFWDGELINVLEPLERNLSLIKILYPVTFVLSILMAGILAFMMVLRRTLDVSILRILGVKNKEVSWNLFRENLILVLIGISAACISILLITAKSFQIDLTKYVMVSGGYLSGTIAGLFLGIRKVTNKKPLEMLQVKE